MFPTAIEGYGLPPVEAMACKVPVVVLGDAIIPWEVKSRCVQVADLNYALLIMSSIVTRNGQLLDLNQLVDIEDNYRFAMTHDWDSTMSKYLELYEAVAGK